MSWASRNLSALVFVAGLLTFSVGVAQLASVGAALTCVGLVLMAVAVWPYVRPVRKV